MHTDFIKGDLVYVYAGYHDNKYLCIIIQCNYVVNLTS